MLTGYQPDFAVMQGRNPIGIVARHDVLQALATQPADTLVTEIMAREYLKMGAVQLLDVMRQVIQEQGARVAAAHDSANYLN